MTVPLGPDRATDLVYGIDQAHHGLLCRADPLCRVAFQVGPSMDEAARLRDQHELVGHGYRHQVQITHAWAFGQRVSQHGRSTLRRPATKRA